GFGGSHTAGPHTSNTANELDPRVDSDRSSYGHSSTKPLSNSTSGYGANNSYGSSYGNNTTAGPHTSNVANEMDPRVDSDRSSTGFNRSHQGSVPGNGLGHAGGTSGYTGASGYDRTTGPASSTAGPHTSNVANEADPRVDSDMSSGRNFSTHDRTTGPASSTAGPHSSNVANEADPRVDSDLDSTGARNSVSRTSRTTGPASSTAGPHSSNVANEADPRVDSDMSSARHSTTTGSTNANTKGAHINTSLPNALGHEGNIRGSITGQATEGMDPRVDSDRDNRARHEDMASSSYNTPGSGRASGTAGPHDSNVGNKMDPTVDSDMDGS
ncbi:hypothetical protein P170DRAFT_314577, partial [Aspergillus steynii IBT 23096]